MFSELQNELDARVAQGLLRTHRTVETPQSPHIVVDGKAYLAFCSNDYLGLANHPQLIHALQQGVAQWGVGSGAAHLVSGHFTPHHQLEQQLAAFIGKPAALLFSTGYMANLGVVQILVGKGDTVFADKLNHASLNDAMLLSRAEVKRYRHGDLVQLEKLLCETSAGRKLIITDAVFSMDGDLAPLPELLDLCERYDAWLYVDDAHGFGVLGEQGRGSLFHSFESVEQITSLPPLRGKVGMGVESSNPSISTPSLTLPLQGGGDKETAVLNSPRIIYMATLGKAAGVSGAFVAAEQVVVNTLINHARSYVYTTAAPPALSVALLQSLTLIEQGDTLRSHLQRLIAQLRESLSGLPWQLMPSHTAIQPLVIGDNQQALKLSEALRERGIWVAAIRPPTVPQGTARLRITLSAAHRTEDMQQLIEALHELARKSDTARSAAVAPSPYGGGLHPQGVGRGCTGLKPQQRTLG
jgi:8-amino-7-oxononanoate synthase